MLSQAVTNQVRQKSGARQEGAGTSRIREFLRMNPPSFTSSSTTEDPETFIEELKKWKGGRAEDAPPASWACFEEAFLGRFFPQELKEAKVREFLTLKQDSLSVREYGLKFTQLSRHAPEIVADMGSRMSLFVAGLSRMSCKEEGHFLKECPKNRQGSGNQGNRAQSSSVAPLDRAAPRGATSGTSRGTNHLYAITSRQEQENSPNVVTGMIKVFAFDVMLY
ncbi:hypothetical protein R3W88_001588 [Solanum pinnatisectum]|uniref:Retrotransposon gag domain-containing protein n=1 Tax=Solanum pinnatisectum TaxID=50273 RepID=A0AAV9MIL4_9SOLN|nr:hypothetical protein R3W88_001588 [Solanum pinnatisectum]